MQDFSGNCPMDRQQIGNICPLPTDELCNSFVHAGTRYHPLPLDQPSTSSGMVSARVAELDATRRAVTAGMGRLSVI